jgi:4-hydroxy-2-oxoheptanedioate aldolase
MEVLLMKNSLKSKLINGEKVVGVIIGDYSPSMVELVGHVGFDFVFIDDEHGAFSYTELEHMVRAADAVNLTPIVRVSYDESSIQKVLDRGAKGIHVPMVNTKEDAERVVEKAKFPPDGKRGAAYYIRAAQYGKLGGTDYLQKANDETLVIVHIETPQAVANFEEIISVPGIDMAFVGATDLAVSMGYSDGPQHPEVQKVIQELFEKGQKSGILMGAVAGSKEEVRSELERGANYVAVVGTSIISRAFTEVLNSTRVH